MAEGEETVFRTGIEFHLLGEPDKKMEGITKATDKLRDRVKETTKEYLLMGAGILGVGVGVRELFGQVMEGNVELDQTVKKVAGVLYAFQDWKKGVTPVQAIGQSLINAREAAERFEETEERLARPMPEIAEGYKLLAGPVLERLGKGREYLLNLTDEAADAAVVFGESVSEVASSITRTLETGKVRGIDPFSVAMKHALGDTKNLSREKVFEKMEKEMKNLRPAAEAMTHDFESSMFRLRDFVGDTIRDVGAPAFQFIAEKVEKFSKALKTTLGDGRTLGEVYGEKLLRGFKMLAEVGEQIVGHWKEFALLWGGMKLSTGLGGLAEMFGGGEKKKEAAKGFAGALGNFAGQLSTATTVVTGFYTAAVLFSDWVDRQHPGTEGAVGGAAQLTTLSGALSQNNLKGAYKILASEMKLASATDLGMGQGQGVQLDRAGLSNRVNQLSWRERRLMYKQMGFSGDAEDSPRTWREGGVASQAITAEITRRMSGYSMKQSYAATASAPELAQKNKQINNFYGGIQVKQDFLDNDPDNVWVTMKEDIEKQASRRVQSTSGDPFAGG